MAATNFNNSQIGLPLIIFKTIANGGSSTFAMAAVNSCFAVRFRARTTKDIKTVRVKWGTVTAGGIVEVRIETIEATTNPGKPTGTLYDANATVQFNPPSTTGFQAATFATLPTTGLVVGTEYAVVLLTTTLGTTHTLWAYFADTVGSVYPSIVLTAADGSISGSPASRAGMAEVGNSVGCISIVYEDDTEEDLLVNPWGTNSFGTNNIFSTTTASAKMVTSGTLKLDGVWGQMTKTGTPAGDLIAKVYESDGTTLVANTTVTIDKDSLGVIGNRRVIFPFDSFIQLSAGTYYITFSSPSSANSSNCYTLRSATFHSAAGVAAHRLSTSGAGDSTTEMASAGFLINDVVAGGGGGSSPVEITCPVIVAPWRSVGY